MGLDFQLPFLIISNCAQLQKHHPFSFLLLFDDEVIVYCIIPSLQLNLTMPWHFNRKGGCYHYGHSYPLQKRVQVIATYLATLSTAITAEICQVSYNVTVLPSMWNCSNKKQLWAKLSVTICVQGKLCGGWRPNLKLLRDSTLQFIFENYKRYSQTISSLVHTRFPR